MYTIALAGTPNSGKTTLFNALTGLHQKVGNYPGVTIERKTAIIHLANEVLTQWTDLPGTYSLYARSAEERITYQELVTADKRPDLIVCVADTNLRRSLLLCTQLVDLGYAVVLALNFADSVVTGALPDTGRLSGILGLPVVSISALNGSGLRQLCEVVAQQLRQPKNVTAATPRFFKIPTGLQGQYTNDESSQSFSTYAAYLKAIQASPPLIPHADELIRNELLVRYDRIDQLIGQANEPKAEKVVFNDWSYRLDKVLLHPILGYLSMLVLLLLIFQFLFIWSAIPMDWIDGMMAALGTWQKEQLPVGFLSQLWVDGIWAGLQGIVIFLPQIALLFFFLALLEGSGLMARLVFLSDHVLRKFGLSGRSVIPLLGGFACAVPSIMATRTISNPREKLLLILLLPLMSCAARIPVYTILVALLFPADQSWWGIDSRAWILAALYSMGPLVALLVMSVVKMTLKPVYDSHTFLFEMPPYRLPRWKNVLLEVWLRCKAFLGQAGKVILAIALILWALIHFGPGSEREELHARYLSEQSDSVQAVLAGQLLQSSWAGYIGRWIEPVIQPLGYDWKIGIALLASFAAREVFVSTMSTLYATVNLEEDSGFLRLTERLKRETDTAVGAPRFRPAVVWSLLIFYVFALQCMSTLAVIKKETGGWYWALIALLSQTTVAYLSAWIVFTLLD